MRLKEFMKETGASARQIDYWVRAGMRLTTTDKHGSGEWRDYDPEMIPAIRICAEVSNSFKTTFPIEYLKKIVENYPYGSFQLTEHVSMTWECNGSRTNASPKKRFRVFRQR